MNHFEKDFESIFHTVTGSHCFTPGVPWVRNLFAEGTSYNQAYRTLWDSRVSIGERFAIPWEEDEDLERMMNAICDIETAIALEMFRYGMEYAQRGFKL